MPRRDTVNAMTNDHTTTPRLDAPHAPVPVAGSVQVRVRYCECDPMGVAHHASYVPWFEIGRTELLRDAGLSYAAMEKSGYFLVITKLETRYRRPIRYDDLVEIRTRVESTSRIKIRHAYEVVLIERDGRPPDTTDPAIPSDLVCSIGVTELACVGRDGRPRELPEWLGPGKA